MKSDKLIKWNWQSKLHANSKEKDKIFKRNWKANSNYKLQAKWQANQKKKQADWNEKWQANQKKSDKLTQMKSDKLND